MQRTECIFTDHISNASIAMNYIFMQHAVCVGLCMRCAHREPRLTPSEMLEGSLLNFQGLIRGTYCMPFVGGYGYSLSMVWLGDMKHSTNNQVQ